MEQAGVILRRNLSIKNFTYPDELNPIQSSRVNVLEEKTLLKIDRILQSRFKVVVYGFLLPLSSAAKFK